MLKREFERLAGYEVSNEDYVEIIEPMYMATEMSKEDFVKCISKKRFALKPRTKYIEEMRALAKYYKENCYRIFLGDIRDRLDNLTNEYIKRYYGNDAGYHYNNKERYAAYYPSEIMIYSTIDYKTWEKINLT